MEWGILIGCVVLGVGLMVVWMRRTTATRGARIPPADSTLPAAMSAPDTTSTHDVAQQHLIRLQQASSALFGPEYLATSSVSAWKEAYPDVLTLAADRSWLRHLPDTLRDVAEGYCQPFRDLPDAVKLHNDRFITTRLTEDEAAFDRVERFPLTARQRQAIVTNEDTTLVIAGAGTGKTSTILGKVDYLLRHHMAAPHEILVLAYAKKAAEELQTRINALGHTGVEIQTFHALGRRIITAARGHMQNISRLGINQDDRLAFLQSCLTDLWLDPSQRLILLDFFVSLLDEPHTAQTATSGTAPAPRFRTLTGAILRSTQEVQIANWLTLHGIRREYERPYPIATGTDERRQYHPDFYLPTYDLYLEHFGIDRQGRTRADIDATQYQHDMEWKRDLHRQNGTRLLETYSYFEAEGGIPHHLEQILRDAGVVFQPLPASQIAALFADTLSPANAFVRLLDQFLQLFDGSGLPYATVQARATTPRDHAFLSIFHPIAERYHAELLRTESIDFNGMITEARAAIQARAYSSPFRYLIVDEFQDISPLRLGFLLDLRAHVAHAKLFVVGDDWQAIYRFAGSDISIITNLKAHVGPTARVDLDTTFRYPQEILDASALFVTVNAAQFTKDLRAYAGAAGEPPLVFVHQETTTPEAGSQALEAALTDIQRRLGGKPGSVLILGRYNRLKPPDLAERISNLESQGITLLYQSMHASKGKEADYVILVGLESGRLSFPSTIPDDPLVRLVLADAETFPFAEERRLFYVALTRARKQVYLIVPPTQVSPFVSELRTARYAPYITTLVESPLHYPCPVCAAETILRHETRRGIQWRCVAVPACSGELKTCPSCHEGAMLPCDDPEPAEHCRRCGHTLRVCPRCQSGHLIERTGKHGVFLACSAWQGGAGCRFTQSLSVAASMTDRDPPHSRAINQ